MMDIQIPDEFRKACRNLGQGLEVTTADELVQYALIGIDHDDARSIKAFLDDLLNGDYSADQLKEFWWSTPADIVLYDGEGVRTFLTMIRDALDKPPYVTAPPE
jgi:hypothetical protein